MAHEIDPTLRPLHAEVYEAIREAWYWFGEAPSQAELQRACQCSSTSIQNAFRELRKRGLIVAPKFGSRVAKPTDIDRTVSVAPLDPWAELARPDIPRFWKLNDQK